MDLTGVPIAVPRLQDLRTDESVEEVVQLGLREAAQVGEGFCIRSSGVHLCARRAQERSAVRLAVRPEARRWSPSAEPSARLGPARFEPLPGRSCRCRGVAPPRPLTPAWSCRETPQPDLDCGFRGPGYPVVPILSILACGYLIYELPLETYLLFGGWLTLAVAVYLLYRRRNSRLQEAADPASEQTSARRTADQLAPST